MHKVKQINNEFYMIIRLKKDNITKNSANDFQSSFTSWKIIVHKASFNT